MSDDFSAEKAPRAVAAVRRLMSKHAKEQVIAKPLGGINAQAFKVDAGADSYFVRVLPDVGEWDEICMAYVPSCVANTIALGEVRATAPVLAADEEAVVQAFLPGERMEYQNWTELPKDQQCFEARRIGEMIAAIHSVPCSDPAHPPAAHGHYNWDIKQERHALAHSLQECWKYIDSREAPGGIGGEMVLTHGDLHSKNVMVLQDGSLLAVDLELSGRGHRAFDLAFFFWHWEWFTETVYPCFQARQAIARSYLVAARYPATDLDVHNLLWEIEYVVIRIALLRANHPEVRQETQDVFKVQLPLACELLRVAKSGDLAIHSAVVEQGILPLSYSRIVSEAVTVTPQISHCPRKTYSAESETTTAASDSESDATMQDPFEQVTIVKVF